MRKILSSVIEVTASDRIESSTSSKGNQIKWRTRNGLWLKADSMGYEGLAEYAASLTLAGSNIGEVTEYYPCLISEQGLTRRGCVSEDFLREGETLVTVKHLYQQQRGYDIYSKLEGLSSAQRLETVITDVTDMTGISDFGIWLGRLLEFDAFILNEDRHLNNIAVIQQGDETYRKMPVFDNGAGLLSDTSKDFPVRMGVRTAISKVKSKPFATEFRKQLKAVSEVVGLSLKLRPLTFDSLSTDIYEAQQFTRVHSVLRHQAAKYEHLFYHNKEMS